MSGKRIPDGFIRRCAWAACLFTLFGIVTWVASGNLAKVFIPLGALITAGRLYGLWTSMRLQKGSEPGIRNSISVLAADLVLLFAVHHGFLQARIEMDRGNLLGAILSLGIVTPVLALLARDVALTVGKKLFRI